MIQASHEQVSKLCSGVGKGMLPVRRLAPKILMAVNYCLRQQSRGLSWTTSAYLRKEGANPHHGACRHIWQYDGRPDRRLGVHFFMWNIGSLNGKREV